jgi:acetylornithine/N-succinyldiaminopimelate aminotransferase
MCFEPGDQGGTYCGNPLMAAVGLAVVDAVAQPAFLAHVNGRGAQLERGLATLIERRGLAGQRGRGLLRALDLGEPVANQVVDAARALAPDGLLLNTPRPNLLRFMPALNVQAEEVTQMLQLLDQVLQEVL